MSNTIVYGVTNGGKASFHHIQTRQSMSEPCSFISFKTHLLLKPGLSLKFHSGNYRTRTNACVGNLCVEDKESFYDLLGISESGTLSDIKQAYKQLARKYHPDVSPPDRVEEYTKMFIQVQEAYETLSDPNGRALYDRDMARGLHFAYSASQKFRYKQGLDCEKDEWRKWWQIQLRELHRRSKNGDSAENLSWGSRMRRRNQINHQ
ncbi:chaperone protein dnaJ 20 chloroplastic-like isoform X1 [Tripterygium wilfordii]|uniref:Chaperone protein dnaJ 20 chloroplastic-like isoform X1 n=1 Tax=Tripterygium wilfordii TaxID=458696 RepID=A0A7J7BXH0_TRIWF|nr:chaperone protein dnaJ 20, chloroplastic-like [Tripterygium wilfordii]KAF5726572.1 chaperone protein dnaJ 20 chloroplastic-like isoform X1 [Tripterygium wilfordii]